MPDFEPTYDLHPAMRLLLRAIRRELWLKLFVAVLFLASGLALAWYFFKRQNLLVTFGMAAVVLGVKFLWEYLRQPKAEDARLWQLLHRQPRHIVWVYWVKEQLMPFGMLLKERGTLYFMLADGGEITLALPVEKLRMVSKFLNRLLPHASFGYTKDREAQFEANPASLLRADDELPDAEGR